MAVKARIPKAIRKSEQTGVPVPANISLNIDTLQLAHEALVQMRKPNSQVTLAVAKAMSELEALITMFGAQQQQRQTEQGQPSAEDEAPAPTPVPAPAPIRKGK